MKKVLVTGANGFIGRQVLPILTARGFQVHAIFSRSPLPNTPQVVWHRLDLLENNHSELLSKIAAEYMLHFAWYVSPEDYRTSSENKRWKDSTIELVRTFRETGGQRAVLAGTCMEYEWTTSPATLHEHSSPLAFISEYGSAKNDTRLAVERYAKESELSLAWGRIFNVYGPFEASRRFVPTAIRALRSGTIPNISNEITFDYMHVSDVADAFVRLLESNVSGPVNIASGQGVKLHELAEKISELLETKKLLSKGSNATKAQETIVANVDRLRNELHWSPRLDLTQGLQETIEWWEKQDSA